MIERYLAELRPLLPFGVRRRSLAEVAEHLRASAEEHGEDEAIRRFGPAADVARGLAAVHATRAVAVAGASALALAATPVLAYGIVENSLPAAPWAPGEMPVQLEWKIRGALVLYVLALVLLAAAGAVYATARRLALGAIVGAVAAVGAMGILGGVLNVQWADAVPGTPGWLPVVGAVQALLAFAAAVPAVEAARLLRARR